MGSLYRRTKDGPWQAEWTSHIGKRQQRSTGTRSKKTAQRILNHWEEESVKRSTGLIDANQERLAQQASRPITEHVKEFLGSLQSKSSEETNHIRGVKMHIEAVIESGGWSSLGDVRAEDVDRYAVSMQDAGSYPRTVQAHLRSIKQFTSWAVKTNRLSADPLSGVKPPSPDSKRKIERRAFTIEEWRCLRDATEMAGVSFSLSGSERALLYETSLQTGLRANELRQLLTTKLSLGGSKPHVLALKKSTKNKLIARQYVTLSLAKRLKSRPAGKYVFPHVPEKTAEMLRRDLLLARAAYTEQHGEDSSDFLTEKNAAGERYDFHALRHTCGAWLAMAEVHPKAIQTIMRHSSITLTMDTYGHLFPSMEAEAIAKLGEILES